jgi:glycosyltransferase involved in cell wall biosynthesis
MSMSSVSDMSKEIVVVDNGSQDGTRDLLRSWAAGADCTTTIVEEGDGGLATACASCSGDRRRMSRLTTVTAKRSLGNMRGMMRMIAAGAGRRTGRII